MWMWINGSPHKEQTNNNFWTLDELIIDWINLKTCLSQSKKSQQRLNADDLCNNPLIKFTVSSPAKFSQLNQWTSRENFKWSDWITSPSAQSPNFKRISQNCWIQSSVAWWRFALCAALLFDNLLEDKEPPKDPKDRSVKHLYFFYPWFVPLHWSLLNQISCRTITLTQT